MSFDIELKPQSPFSVNFGVIERPKRLGYLLVDGEWKRIRDTFICISEEWKKISSKYVLVDGVWKSVLESVPIEPPPIAVEPPPIAVEPPPIAVTDINFVESIDFAVNTTTPTGPTIPNYVDDTYLGVIMEFTSSLSGASTPPSGWTQFLTQPSPFNSGAGLSICYKILSESDRGTSPGAIVGGNQRDQLFIFKNDNGTINSITEGNFQRSGVTGALSANAPSLSPNQSAIAIHYFYNSTTATPTVSSTPTMTLMRSTVNNFHGGQYIIYNPSETPQNQETNATLAGTITQALFWLIVE
jgi:hypothetical protein